MKIPLFLVPLAVLTLLAPFSDAGAQTLLSENWEGYTPGATPVAPWQARFGEGDDPAVSKITIVEQTIGSATSNWALVGNNAKNEPVGNPNLLATFTPTSSLLNISFSFMIPANYGNDSQEFFTLGRILGDGSTQTALSIYLGPNYQATNSMLGYRSAENTRVNLGGNFAAGQQVNVSLTNINNTLRTYDIAWSTSGGASGSVTGIAFTNAAFAGNFNFISFGESSQKLSTSLLYVDNIQVVAVPEPGTLALGLVSGLALVASRRRRRG
jgi:hypothetical protein